MVDTLAAKTRMSADPKLRVLVFLDAGIATWDNLREIKARDAHSDEKQKSVVPSEASEPAKKVTTARKTEKRGQSWAKNLGV